MTKEARTASGVIATAENKGDSERRLIERVLRTIEDRMAAHRAADDDAQLHEHTKRRLDSMAADLETATETLQQALELIARLQEQLNNTDDDVPPQLRKAMRAHSSQFQPVRLRLGHRIMGFAIEPSGRDDPEAEAQLWRTLNERYGEAT